MHGPINVKSPNNTSKWQMGFNSAFKGLTILFSSTNPNLRINLIVVTMGPPKLDITINQAVYFAQNTAKLYDIGI
jgi:hypothetical protein